MGIRFHCPNGHKLNVKSFLAGKRGICPYCDAKFIIPRKSLGKQERVELETDAREERSKQSVVGSSPADSDEPPHSANRVQQAGRSPANQVGPGTVQQSVTHVGTTGAGTVKPGTDPLSEAPNAIWYVRLPSGDQFGPAQSAIMSRWLAEGRVAADSLVWREDWPQWQSAVSVFPQLANPPKAAAGAAAAVPAPAPAPAETGPPTFDPDTVVAAPAAPVANVSQPRTSPLVVQTRDAKRLRRRTANRSVAILVFLIVVVLILIPIVGYVLWNSS